MTTEGRAKPIHALFGFLMGAADVVPGVSGGTVALILGIYERLIAAIGQLASAAGNAARGRIGMAIETARRVDWAFLVLLGTGIVTALIVGARVIEPLMHGYPVQLRALFFGLIAASVAIPWRAIRGRDRRHTAIAALTAIIAFALVGIPPREVSDPPLVAVFLSAMIAICAMILPGVSGAFLLLVMGMYQPALQAINERDLLFVAVFMAGAAVGIGSFSKLLSFLLRTHHDVTMAALVGLMVGSLRALWPFQDESRGLQAPPSVEEMLMALAISVIGFAFVVAVTRLVVPAERTPAGTSTQR